MRTQVNLLSLAIEDLNKTNTNLILNISKLPNEKINPLNDIKLKEELLQFKY
jgi:hypothetical protein